MEQAQKPRKVRAPRKEVDESSIGGKLRRARVTAKMTQAELAEKCGMQQPAIARAETGRVTPTLEFIEKVAKACGHSLEIELKAKAKPKS